MKTEKITTLVINPDADLHAMFVKHNGAVTLAVAGNKEGSEIERTRLGEEVMLLMHKAFRLGMEEGQKGEDV